MDNTTYEFFIRRCWDCERFKHGANTDTWEDLLIKNYNFKNSNDFNKKVLEKEYLKKLEQVKNFIDKAFNKLISKATKKKVNQNILNTLLTNQTTVKNSLESKEIWDILRTIFPIRNEHSL